MGIISSKSDKTNIEVTSSKFKEIKQLFCLDDPHISKFYSLFMQFDRFRRSYIDMDDFVSFFKSEHDNFVELPFA